MQSTHNRDEYVTIHWENIRSGTEENFEKYNNTLVTDFDTTYDYYSILHYSAYGFSTNGNATIVPKVSLNSLQKTFNLEFNEIFLLKIGRILFENNWTTLWIE